MVEAVEAAATVVVVAEVAADSFPYPAYSSNEMDFKTGSQETFQWIDKVRAART